MWSTYAGTHFTDLEKMESWVNFSGKEGDTDIEPSKEAGDRLWDLLVGNNYYCIIDGYLKSHQYHTVHLDACKVKHTSMKAIQQLPPRERGEEIIEGGRTAIQASPASQLPWDGVSSGLPLHPSLFLFVPGIQIKYPTSEMNRHKSIKAPYNLLLWDPTGLLMYCILYQGGALHKESPL